MMRAFATEVYNAVKAGKLLQPFNAAMAKDACPGWANRTYHTFFGKHSVGNGEETELFVRLRRGFYCLNKEQASQKG
jgi:hypothetical protein